MCRYIDYAGARYRRRTSYARNIKRTYTGYRLNKKTWLLPVTRWLSKPHHILPAMGVFFLLSRFFSRARVSAVPPDLCDTITTLPLLLLPPSLGSRWRPVERAITNPLVIPTQLPKFGVHCCRRARAIIQQGEDSAGKKKIARMFRNFGKHVYHYVLCPFVT